MVVKVLRASKEEKTIDFEVLKKVDNTDNNTNTNKKTNN